MATVLSGSPPSFNKTDVAGTVKALCNYTRTLQESIDFILGQLTKDMSATKSDLGNVKSSVNTMGGTLSSVTNDISSLGRSYNTLAARVSALEQKTQ